MKMKPLPSQARLLELFTYDPLTGELRRRTAVGGRPTGSIAGTKKQNKTQRKIQVCVDYQMYATHNLIFKMVKGYDPPVILDHRDNDGWNNRWRNLRLAGKSLNNANSRLRSDNLSGYKGVHKEMYFGNIRYRAVIERNKKRYHLGRFKTAKEAHVAYVAAAKIHFGPFHNPG